MANGEIIERQCPSNVRMCAPECGALDGVPRDALFTPREPASSEKENRRHEAPG
ncbi:hypothetical protein ZHAS_00012232 [Anopheles sinensis]|uniref:Uncharacterized protein n=1 Tax=Anopheles sinensis TaxID=74873 RepID=A0A084W2K2_ANOSI|nr:hypothetical protein ZHAS_00012232 [Anopheles sinensis]